MPFARMHAALLPAAAFLVLSTAQRMLLLWLLAPRLRVGWSDAFAALALGARMDAACAAVAVLPLAAWCSALPERAWKSRLHRLLLGALFASSLVAVISFLAVDGLQFWVHHARLSHPFRERLLVAWRLLAGDEARAPLAVAFGVACLVTGLAVALLLRRAFRSSWKEKISGLLRGRDFVLALGACVLFFALRPHGAPFPGTPVLGEIAGSSVPAVARAAWDRVTREPR